MNVSELVHPNYTKMEPLWKLWRDIAKSGEDFIDTYLVRRYKENSLDYVNRKRMTYIPAFAKAGLNQIRNSVRQRMMDVSRLGGSKSYQLACEGLSKWGVDRARSSMNKFMGYGVLDDLTAMGTVGVYVDAPGKSVNDTAYDDIEKVPYLYMYPVESIRAWTTDERNPNLYTRLLLRDYQKVIDPEFGLTIDYAESYRYYYINKDRRVAVRFYDKDGKQVDINNQESSNEYILDIPEIPFVMGQLSDSLLADICRYQIALLNLGSADMKAAWEGNIVFLAEKYDPNSPESYFKNTVSDQDGALPEDEHPLNRDSETRFLGIDRGIRVPKDVDYPQYISPPANALAASMAKEQELKEQIQELLNQNLATISSRSSSTQIHSVNERREEDGLKAIGDELEYMERQIAYYWAMYEGSKKAAEVYYPRCYEFKTDADRREEAKELSQLMMSTPSKTAQKALAAKAVLSLLGDDISGEEADTIVTEIKAAKSMLSDPLAIAKLVEDNVLSPEGAALQLGFSAEEAQKAQEAQIERASAIAIAQSNANANAQAKAGARGVSDLSATPKEDARNEKAAAKAAGKKVVKDGSTASA